MLNQPPIFLGGQGGIIGPLRLGYGNVVAAGCVLREDHPENNKLIYETAGTGCVKDYVPAAYPGFRRVVENNILYLANLAALEAWYREVRKPFLEKQEIRHPSLYRRSGPAFGGQEGTQQKARGDGRKSRCRGLAGAAAGIDPVQAGIS